MAPRWTWSVFPCPLFLRSLSLSLPDVAVVVSAGYAFVLDGFGEHLLPAGVAVGVVDHYLVSVKNSVAKLGFGFTVGGIGIADIFLGHTSLLGYWCDESEFVYGVDVCCRRCRPRSLTFHRWLFRLFVRLFRFIVMCVSYIVNPFGLCSQDDLRLR